jgi:hypothetical protein
MLTGIILMALLRGCWVEKYPKTGIIRPDNLTGD